MKTDQKRSTVLVQTSIGYEDYFHSVSRNPDTLDGVD